MSHPDWSVDAVGLWRLDVSPEAKGVVFMRPSARRTDPHSWIARATNCGHTVMTTHPSGDAARTWVEYELGARAAITAYYRDKSSSGQPPPTPR